ERRRLDEEDGEDQRDRGERLLAAGKQVDALQLLARRLGHDLDARLVLVVALDQHQPRAAAVEEPREDLLELLVDDRERLPEALLRGPVDLGDRLAELRQRVLEVLLLLRQELVALG